MKLRADQITMLTERYYYHRERAQYYSDQGIHTSAMLHLGKALAILETLDVLGLDIGLDRMGD